MNTAAAAGPPLPKSRWANLWGDTAAAVVVTLAALSFYLSAASVDAAAPAATLLPTTIARLALAAVAVGACWWLMGRSGWGDLIRYIPYPVVGGFLGAIGWLMLTGGPGVAMGQGFTLARAAAWMGGAADARLLVGLGLGVLIWRATLRFKQPVTLPRVLLAGTAAIHAGVRLAGLDIATAQSLARLFKAARAQGVAVGSSRLDARRLFVLQSASRVAQLTTQAHALAR